MSDTMYDDILKPDLYVTNWHECTIYYYVVVICVISTSCLDMQHIYKLSIILELYYVGPFIKLLTLFIYFFGASLAFQFSTFHISYSKMELMPNLNNL